MCRGRAAEVWFLRGWRSTALTPGYLISPRFFFWAPALGQPKLRGIKTNAQPAPATSPCRSAHLLLMFLGEEMVGCHVSVSSHVMPLPALVHSLGHQFVSDLWSSQAHRAYCEGPGESSPPCPLLSQLQRRAKQASLGVGPLRCQQPASSLSPWPSPTNQTKIWTVLLIFKGGAAVFQRQSSTSPAYQRQTILGRH